jgi:4-amino-4-deoxy-L-arabinose transferase-like glycosyltransferase
MSESPAPKPWKLTADHLAGIVVIGSAALVLSVMSMQCWTMLLLDGLYTGVVLVAAWGMGIWPVWGMLGRQVTALQRGCLALGLGLGLTGMLTLILGMLGWLSQMSAAGILTLGVAAGLAWWNQPQGQGDGSEIEPQSEVLRSRIVRGLVVLPVGYALGMLLFLATLPPGMVWSGEGFGYDVMEYHLQAPREYFDAAFIHFLPHNVYSNFPQQVEIHYLLLMHLTQGDLAAAIPAQLFHAALTIAAVIALGAFVAPGWGRLIAWLVAGSVPALIYTGCLAYVEGGLLLYTALAGGLAIRLLGQEADTSWQAWVLVGLMAGLAGACKYTGLVLVAVPLALLVAALLRSGIRQRVGVFLVIGLAATAAMSPWLIRNMIFTGNPVFPLAYSVFGGEAWSAEQDQQWQRAHALPEAQQPPGPRLSLAWREIVSKEMFGAGFLVLALGAVLIRWDRSTWLLAGWSVAMLIVWMTLTYMPWRLLMPMIAPLALLIGRTLDWTGRGQSLYDTNQRHEAPIWLRTPIVLMALLSALWQAATIRAMVRQADQDTQRRFAAPEISLATTVGAVHEFRTLMPANNLTPPEAVLWQVGDAAVFYVDREQHYFVTFNRDPWLEFAAEHTPAESIDYLRSRNVTHVVFSWSEIQRLRQTYGFSEIVTRDWVRALAAAGLQASEVPGAGAADYEVYAVTPQE